MAAAKQTAETRLNPILRTALALGTGMALGFLLIFFLFISPMFLFSGTFFPVSNLPAWAQPFAMAFPLHHLVELFRGLCAGTHETPTWISLVYLPLFLTVFGVLALVMMKRRLIR